MGLVLSGGITRARERRRSGAFRGSKPADYIGFTRRARNAAAAPQRWRCARVAGRSAARKAPTIMSSAEPRDGCSSCRASSPSTNILMCGRIASCSSTIRNRSPGKPGVEVAQRLVERRVRWKLRRSPRRPCRSAAGRECGRSCAAKRRPGASRLCRSCALDGVDVRQVPRQAFPAAALRHDCPRPRRSSCRSKRPLSARDPPSLPVA